MLSLYNVLQQYIPSGSTADTTPASLLVNGFKIYKPSRFKNIAHERAYEIALVLASKQPAYTHSQRMGEITIVTKAPVKMATSECIDVIMFNGIPEIQLKTSASDPDKSARDAMKFVPSFFDEGVVVMEILKRPKRIWYLEIKS